MHEDLIGYLLGALEPHEMRRVEAWLRDDPEARGHLAEAERMLRPLEEHFEPIEPPPSDLIARTMASLPPLPPKPTPSHPAPSHASPEVLGDEAVGRPASDSAVLSPMQSKVEPPRSVGWSWMDWAVGCAAAAVLLALLLPTIAEGRFEARKTACQDQLRQLGTAITQFVIRSEQSRLPAVSASGPEAFAGVYAVRLRDAGLLDSPELRWCPSLDRPVAVDSLVGNMPGSPPLVSIGSLHDVSVDRLRQIQQYAGGHYAYTLGVIDQGGFASPRYESRSSFAVMSDAPLAGMASRASLEDSIGHSGLGINVLYEDGRVQFVSVPALSAIPDHPLRNHRGQSEAGVNVDDASLAPSWHPPFVEVRQR